MSDALNGRLTAALQEIANLAARHAVEAFQLRQRIAELESRVAEPAEAPPSRMPDSIPASPA